MNRVKVEKSNDYTVISNVFLRDKKLSLKAKGMLAVIMSLPNNWDFSINGLDKIISEGKRAIYSTIDELIECGYCQRKQLRAEIGFGEMEYTFSEKPKQNVHTHNVDAQVVDTHNAPQYNTDRLSTDKEEVNKKDNNDFDCFWSLYPNKVAKEKCLSKWRKLSKNDKEKILDTIKDFINNKPFETYNHPNPLTYLNQARWNDEIVKKGIKIISPGLEDETKEKIYFRWEGEGNSIKLREVEKDKSEEYFKKAEEGGWIPVFYNKQ